MTEDSLGRDPLTGLHSRWYVLHELERHIKLYQRYRRPFSLLLIRFDNLEWVKDASGDAAGESALEYLTTIIETHLRDVDIVSRCSADEFAVIMQETEKQAAQTAGRRIADSLEKTRIKVGEDFVTMRASFGTASCPEDGLEAEALLKVAGTHV